LIIDILSSGSIIAWYKLINKRLKVQ
jgi:hypothetical protein